MNPQQENELKEATDREQELAQLVAGSAPRISDAELEANARRLEGRQAPEVLAWAARQFSPRITFGTGFGVEGCVLIDLIASLRLPIDLFTLDTGLLFPETYQLWRQLEQRYGVTIRRVSPELTVEAQAVKHRARLWEVDPDHCCELRKIAPLRAALEGYQAWVSAIRRDQTAERAKAQVLERDRRFDLVKVNPLVNWTSEDVWSYARARNVPYNRLHDRGYASIGCAPCTTPLRPGEDARAGRWRGRRKTECGIHLQTSQLKG
jgi:phosphoadenosine phosphosulfate reductase